MIQTDNHVIIARYGEVHLKGKNRDIFMSVLTRNLRKRLGNDYKVDLHNSRYIVRPYDDSAMQIVANTFGLTSVSKCKVASHHEIIGEITKMAGQIGASFKVNVNRADKSFPHKSMDFAAICGETVLKLNPNTKVDVHNPFTTINIDIRENNVAFIYDNAIPAVGGLPYGTSGKALVLLSGGIDSPVASFLAAKRGLSIEFVHFTTPPYTSAFSVDKVRRLVEKLGGYFGEVKLHEISITDFMQQVKAKCDKQYSITLMRRQMMRDAKRICNEYGIHCIVTGENLAQVASQTIQGITTTNAIAGDLPILRPLITYDKSEIITLAKRIGTYEISIEPHDDCCNVFVPDAPVISPTIERCLREEARLDN